MSQQESRDHRSSQNASSRGRVQGQPRPNQKSPLTYQCRTRSEQSRVDLYDIYSNAPLRSPLMLTCHAASYTSTTNGMGANPRRSTPAQNRACFSASRAQSKMHHSPRRQRPKARRQKRTQPPEQSQRSAAAAIRRRSDFLSAPSRRCKPRFASKCCPTQHQNFSTPRSDRLRLPI